MNPTSSDPETPPPETDVLPRLLKQLAELFDYASYYLAAKADEAKSSARSLVLHAEVVFVGMLAAAGLIVTAVSLAFIGLAGGLGELFDSRWLGQLVAGLLLFALVALAIWGRAKLIEKHFLRKTVERYEHRQHRQQAKFGHNVADRAAPAPAKD